MVLNGCCIPEPIRYDDEGEDLKNRIDLAKVSCLCVPLRICVTIFTLGSQTILNQSEPHLRVGTTRI